VTGTKMNVVISRVWSGESSSVEFILFRSWSRCRDVKSKFSLLILRPKTRCWQQHWL